MTCHLLIKRKSVNIANYNYTKIGETLNIYKDSSQALLHQLGEILILSNMSVRNDHTNSHEVSTYYSVQVYDSIR